MPPELSHPASEYHAAHFAPPGSTARTRTLACSPIWSEPGHPATVNGARLIQPPPTPQPRPALGGCRTLNQAVLRADIPYQAGRAFTRRTPGSAAVMSNTVALRYPVRPAALAQLRAGPGSLTTSFAVSRRLPCITSVTDAPASAFRHLPACVHNPGRRPVRSIGYRKNVRKPHEYRHCTMSAVTEITQVRPRVRRLWQAVSR